MHHCVASHMEYCLEGKTRIFSVRDESCETRVATVEIKLKGVHWEVTEFKGRCNKEFIHRLKIPNDPLALLMGKVIEWYDLYAPKSFPALQIPCDE